MKGKKGFQKNNKIGPRFQKGNTIGFKKGLKNKNWNGFKKGNHPKTEFKKGRNAWNKGKEKKVSFICKTCGKIKEVPKSYPSKKIYCSLKCRGSGNTGKTHFKKGFIPWNKGKKDIYTKEYKMKISQSSIGKHNREKNANWKGGITPENQKIRHSIEYSLWRETIFQRDNWTCQKCQIRGGKIHAHHIRNFSEEKELRFNNNNGITLCKKCHNLFHKIYGKKHNNEEQMAEFLSNQIIIYGDINN